MTLAPIILTLIVGLGFPVSLVRAALRRRDRLTVADGFLTALVGVVMAWIFVPWDVVPALLWAVPVALTVFGTVLAARSWPELPWIAPGRRRAVALVGTTVGLVIAGAVGWLVLG